MINDTADAAAIEASEHQSNAKSNAPQTHEIVLPDQPVVRIRPRSRWAPLNLRDLWEYRELFYFLVWRDLKVRYKQTLLGASWVLIQPLLTMLIFTFFFGRVVGVQSDGVPYAVFAYAGLLPWNFFASGLTRSSHSLVGNVNLVTKIYFPRLILPGAATIGGLVDMAASFTLLIGLMAYFGMAPTWHWLALPGLVLLTVLLTAGIGLLAAAVNVRYRDVTAIMPFVIQLGIFVTPIIYPLSLVPERWRWVIRLNPLAGIVEGYRAALFGLPFDWWGIGTSVALTLIIFVTAIYLFRALEQTFADTV